MSFKKGIAANPFGRPLKKLSDLPKGWQTTILSRMKKGASKEEIKGVLMMSHDLFTRFMREEALFSETIQMGECLSRQWWEEMGRKNLKSPVFRDRLWGMNMANRFGTATTTVNINKKIDLSKLDAKELDDLAALVAKSSDAEPD